jgi:hypothetical protein
MQVELTKENLAKIEKYRAMVQKDMRSFNPSVTALANEGISSYFDEAIEIQQTINTPKKK